MDLQAVKLDVMQKIMNVSTESLLLKIDQMLDQEMIVGYSVTGEPLTKEKYDQRLANAERQIIEGEVITQENLEKEAENW